MGIYSRRYTMNNLRVIVLGGLVVQTPLSFAASSEVLKVLNSETTKAEITKRVDEVVHEAARYDPELAREIQRQENLVMREIHRGNISDERIIQSIEMYREVQRELSARVAQAADGPAHFEQVYKATLTRNPQEAEQMKAAFEKASRGETVHPTTPEMMDRLLVETKRFTAENPEFAAHAREFANRELDRYQREVKTTTSPHSSDDLHQKREQLLVTGRHPQEITTSHGFRDSSTLFTSVANPKKDSRDAEGIHAVPVREVEHIREAPVHDVERVREMPAREVERVREAPHHEVERIREAPPREAAQTREAARIERSNEHLPQNSHAQQHREQEQKSSQKHH